MLVSALDVCLGVEGQNQLSHTHVKDGESAFPCWGLFGSFMSGLEKSGVISAQPLYLNTWFNTSFAWGPLW